MAPVAVAHNDDSHDRCLNIEQPAVVRVTKKVIGNVTNNVGAGITAPLTGDMVLYADYDVSLSPDQTVQNASVGVRFSW